MSENYDLQKLRDELMHKVDAGGENEFLRGLPEDVRENLLDYTAKIAGEIVTAFERKFERKFKKEHGMSASEYFDVGHPDCLD